MKNAFDPFPAMNSSRSLKVRLIAVAVAVLLIILLVWAPIVVFLLSIVALIVGLLAIFIGRIRWARIPSRKFAGGVAAGSFGMLIVSLVVFGMSLPTETTQIQQFAQTADAAPALEADLASFVGQACEADHLVMTQSDVSNYCDENASGAFVWVDQSTHEQEIALAKAQAEEQAKAEAKAKEDAAKKDAAKKEAAAKKSAQEKAAAEAKKEAAEKAAVVAKTKAKKESAQKAAAEKAEAERSAAVAARKQEEQEAEAQSFVEDTAGSSAYYANCSAVRAAGADPIYAGDPGYSRKLDRDGDGVACE